MSIENIHTDAAPRAVGPYSQAVAVDGWVYCSGQIALDPATETIVGEGDAAAQTERVLANLESVLEAAGASLATVVKTTVFLADLADFAAVNEVYERRFGAHRPARATLQAARLPRSVKVEIDAVARAG